MDTVLFNSHDVILLATVYQCLLLGFVLVVFSPKHRLTNGFLLGFLVTNAVVPLDTLISFGAAFRAWAIDHLPNWFYVFEMGYWLQGPFMLWYLRSRFYKSFRLRAVDLFYLAPFLLFVFHQLLAYHSLPTDVKMEIQRDYSLSTETFTIFFVTLAREVMRFYFGLICVLELRNYIQCIDRKFVQTNTSLIFWLKVGVYSFVGLWGWACIIAIGIILNVHFSAGLPVNAMGLMANYGTCLIFSGLLIALGRESLRNAAWPQLSLRAPVLHPLVDMGKAPSALEEVKVSVPTQPTVNPEYIKRLDELMQGRKIYMESSLTLEALAKELSVSPRTLSTILNRHYGYNFFEFINKHRIEEAKLLLLSEDHQHATMLDIMYEVGFNSKATFNNFFKKMEGVTPREYKKSKLAALSQSS